MKFFPDNKWLLCGLVLVGFALHQFACWNGLGLTYDSRHYLFAAESFRQYNVLLHPDGSAYVSWPPLFPVFLSLLGENALKWSVLINGFLYAGFIYFNYCLFSSFLRHSLIRVLYLLVLVFATPVVLVHSFLWSEPLFILLFSLHWLVMQKFLKNNKIQFLLIAAILGGLCCLQRNAGVFFIAATCLFLFIHEKRQKKILAVIYALPGFCVFIGWNYFVIDSSVRDNVTSQPFKAFFLENTFNFHDWFSLFFLPSYFPVIFRLPGLGVLLSAIVYFLIKNKEHALFGERKILLAILLNVVVYYACIQVIFKFTSSAPERYLSVVYPFIFFFGFYAADLFLEKSKNALAKKILILSISLWMTYPVSRCIKNAIFWHTENRRSESATEGK